MERLLVLMVNTRARDSRSSNFLPTGDTLYSAGVGKTPSTSSGIQGHARGARVPEGTVEALVTAVTGRAQSGVGASHWTQPWSPSLRRPFVPAVSLLLPREVKRIMPRNLKPSFVPHTL